jgi:hypothetical protein
MVALKSASPTGYLLSFPFAFGALVALIISLQSLRDIDGFNHKQLRIF